MVLRGGPGELWARPDGPSRGEAARFASALDDYTQRVNRAGGELVREKTAIPNVGYVAYCRDPEGNVFGIFESDESLDLPQG